MSSVVATQGLQSAGSLVVVHGLSCSGACGIFLDIEPISLALTGEFFTIEPPRKPLCKSYLYIFVLYCFSCEFLYILDTNPLSHI